MKKSNLFLIAVCCSLAFASRAQDAATTNALNTEIENFEAQTGTVIVKGFAQTGSMTTDAGTVSVRCKESIDVGHNRKLYGMAVGLEKDQRREFLFVDYDEMDSLINGMDYLSKIGYNVTTLPGFDATFTTKSGLRLAAHSERRQGGIQLYLKFGDTPKFPLAPTSSRSFKT